MVKLTRPDKTIKEYETLTDVLHDNPGIKEAVLMYYWVSYKTKTEDEYGTTYEYEYDQVDWEYSYVGESDNLENFADDYGVWDKKDIELELDTDGILKGSVENYDYSNPHENGYIPVWFQEEDGLLDVNDLKLSSVLLPSGKRVYL